MATPSMMWSILLDENVEDEEEDENELQVPDISYWRHSLREDVPRLVRMYRDPQTSSMFGWVELEVQLELAHTALTQINEEGDVVSYIALFEYPNIPVVPSFGWLEWIQNLYGIELADERNTLFIHMMLWKRHYSRDFLLPLIESIFLNNVYIQQIILVLPPLVALPHMMEEHFVLVNPVETARSDLRTNTLQRLAICLRHTIVPRLLLRMALESDNDDIAPIFNKLTNAFRNSYGEYYVAEIIAYPTKGRKCIVGEKDHTAIGMMCLNSYINLDTLNENFELITFNGLYKRTTDDIIPCREYSSEDSKEFLRHTGTGDIEELATFTPGRSASILDVAERPSEGMWWRMPKRGMHRGSVYDSVISMSSSSSSSSEELCLESKEKEIIMIDTSMEEVSEIPRRSGLFKHDGSDVRLHRDTTYSTTFFGSQKLSTPMDGRAPWEYSPRTQGFLLDRHREFVPSKGSQRQEVPEPRELPTYMGAPNAFSIEMFGLREDVDERLAFDFLEAAFDCFPDLDFAVLTLPPQYPTFPLLNHFVRVTPTTEFPHELFVAHKNSVLGRVRVRHVEAEDEAQLQALVADLPDKDRLLRDCMLTTSDADTPLRAFVLLAEKTLIGVAVIQPVDDLVYMQSHYDLDAFGDVTLHEESAHASLERFALCPPFAAHARFFLREVQRLGDVACLYHRQPQRQAYAPQAALLVAALGQMLAVRPRRGVQYALDAMEPDNHPQEQVLRPDEPYALFFLNKRLAGVARTQVALRVVVVGASDAGLAFLEALVFGPISAFRIFHNLTLVSVHGIPDDCAVESGCSMIPFRGRYNNGYLARLQLRVHINVIYGVMTAIDRKRKELELDGEPTVAYDYLALCCGRQFQRPTPLRLLKDRDRCFGEHRGGADELQPLPLNVFTVNTPLDAHNALVTLRVLLHRHRLAEVVKSAGSGRSLPPFRATSHLEEESAPCSSPTVIVYGHCLEAYSCVATLLECDIPAKYITVVEAFPTFPSVSCFNDPEVDDAVMSELKDLNVNIYSRCVFKDWLYDDKDKKVTHVSFEAKTRMITLSSIAMFCYGEKKVSYITFLALNQASLVYDGHLVINNKFRTSDPCILAGGPMTKYARVYYADNRQQCYYNSVEIGTLMADELLKEIDPELKYILRRKYVFKKWTDVDDNMACFKLPKFFQPLITCCLLPGGYNYLRVTAPAPEIPLEVAMRQDSYGQVLVTGHCKSDQGYFRLHINQNNIIENVTCYTRTNFAVQNIIQLYGKHERILKYLMKRFEQGFIPDFYAYFEEPWACIVFHDRFNWLVVFLEEYLANCPLFDDASVVDQLAKILYLTKDKLAVEHGMAAVEQVYTGSKVERQIAEEVQKFINRNCDMLTMYPYRMRVREFLRGLQYSSFHRKPQ